MKNIYQRLKDWYPGKYTPLSTQEIFDLVKQSRRYLENQKLNMPDRFKRPLIARIVNSVWKFYCLHFKWIIGTIISLIGLLLLYLQLIKSK